MVRITPIISRSTSHTGDFADEISLRDSMKQVLKEIQDGTFAREWIEENKTGQQNYKRLMQEDLDQRIEKVGKALRGRMSWLQE